MKEHGIRHVTSSPYFPGQAERTFQTVKRLFKRSADPYRAILSYRVTPLPWCNLSPAELLMGRHLRAIVPRTDKALDTPRLFIVETLTGEFRETAVNFESHQTFLQNESPQQLRPERLSPDK